MLRADEGAASASKDCAMTAFTLSDLAVRVKERAQASADVSYTRKLLDRGVAHCAKKLGEEAVETALAAVGEDRERVAAEAADLLYHLLVLLEARGIALAEVETALAGRLSRSGLEEKASRPRD
jgi:phosphoribosyl-ATP pyrophosphohydrolase